MGVEAVAAVFAHFDRSGAGGLLGFAVELPSVAVIQRVPDAQLIDLLRAVPLDHSKPNRLKGMMMGSTAVAAHTGSEDGAGEAGENRTQFCSFS